MIAIYQTVVAIAILLINVSSAQENVPVYMWNVDTDTVNNPLKPSNAEELVNKLASSFVDHKLIAVFMQDELSIEDFKSEDLTSLKSLVESENDGTFYHPSVTDSAKLPHTLKGLGYELIKVKSHEDLPATPVAKPTVLLIELPATQMGDSRSENLQLNANAITQVYEVLQSQQRDVIGIYTAKKNSQVIADGSLRRVTRAAPSLKLTVVEKLINESGTFLYFENAPSLRVKNVEMKISANFTLKDLPVVTVQVYNDTGSTEMTLEYGGVNGDEDSPNSKLNKAILKLTFALKRGYWYIQKSNLTLDVTIGGQSWKDELGLTPNQIATPLGFSYHCTPKLTLANLGPRYGPDLLPPKKIIAFVMNGFQLQPYRVKNNKFGDWYDCQGFFTESIWAGIFLGLIIAMMLAWAVSMLADVRSPDRFDDPKGKTITITATD